MVYVLMAIAVGLSLLVVWIWNQLERQQKLTRRWQETVLVSLGDQVRQLLVEQELVLEAGRHLIVEPHSSKLRVKFTFDRDGQHRRWAVFTLTDDPESVELIFSDASASEYLDLKPLASAAQRIADGMLKHLRVPHPVAA